MNIFISLEAQNQVFAYCHIMFAIAFLLNVIGLVFLFKITPPKQAVIRKYLILIQVMVNLILIDVTFDVGLCPIFLFPAPAGYALGLLMAVGVSAHTGYSLVLLFYVWMGTAIAACIIFRHQTLLPQGSFLKVPKNHLQFGQIFSTLVISTFYIAYAFSANDSKDIERILFEAKQLQLFQSKHNLSWIRDRNVSYYITERTTTLNYGILIGISIMLSSAWMSVSLFAHMLMILQKDRVKRSPQSIILIRRSVLNLFCQLVVPITFFLIPACSILFGVAIENLMSFVFAIALSLDIIGMIFLIKITPPKQAVVRNYLILVQASLILIDINFDVGVCPIFLFPAPAGFASGVLMKIGFSAHLGFSLILLFYVWMGLAINACIRFRHQTLVPVGSIFKLRKELVPITNIIVLILLSAFYVVYAFSGDDATTVDRFIMILGIYGWPYMFAHMFIILQKERAKRSPQSIKLIRRSLLNLFCQLIVPILFFGIPANVILLGVAFPNILSFETSFGLFFLFPWHSVGHNVILLSVTTTYRIRIASFYKTLLKVNQHAKLKQVVPR
ncbi:hypothetical protein PRIPAC_79016 [Pristionchus pacificus]|uniref:G protein-coupled receptor n=1 Tax=Pristionchus pacificus TaxID=54126 RepID=A0A2A6CPG6_PRIPA|nr:hypothetical protein PRIPAC_79016 [Pristionchus pacificus]|eukprot:PDM80084.1 G protein-coupled receptor [Pristionchus pacificus]